MSGDGLLGEWCGARAWHVPDADQEPRMTDHDSDHDSDHATDEADLEERDRPQPNLVTREANRRADDDGTPDREERQALLDEVADDD